MNHLADCTLTSQEIIERFGETDAFFHARRLRSADWICTRCRSHHRSGLPAPMPEGCDLCGNDAFDTFIYFH